MRGRPACMSAKPLSDARALDWQLRSVSDASGTYASGSVRSISTLFNPHPTKGKGSSYHLHKIVLSVFCHDGHRLDMHA